MSHVNILLCTWNGTEFLPQQLESFRAQTHEDWSLVVSDDGSTDGTQEMIRAFGDSVPQQVRLVEGPRQGVTANFLTLLGRPDLAPGYASLADQDDIWFPEKLERALQRMAPQPDDLPVLYCARTVVGHDPDDPMGLSPLPRRIPSLRNALVQCFAGGNTMVLNPAAQALARRAGVHPLPAYHDWWLYLLVSAAGGRVLYDDAPALFYRQHEHNLLGRNRGLQARYARFATIWNGEYHDWVTRNMAALESTIDEITPDNRELLYHFAEARNTRGTRALWQWFKLGLHRQRRLETLLMACTAAAGRI